MKINKDNVIYVDFCLTKRKTKSKGFIHLFKFFSSIVKLIPLPKIKHSSKRYANSASKKTSNY